MSTIAQSRNVVDAICSPPLASRPGASYPAYIKARPLFKNGTAMTDSARTTTTTIRLRATRQRDPIDFDVVPDAATRAALADELKLSHLRKVHFAGRLIPQGRADWALDAALGATLVQPCGVTLAPVTTRVDETVTRRYVAGHDEGDPPDETEMPDEVDIEPLPATLDLMAVLTEALALAVPAFPRAEGAEMGAAVFAEPGTEPLRDEDARPFAGLRDALKGKTP